MVCFEWRKLKEHKKTYVTHDLEFVAIVHALKMLRQYLLGKRFELIIDHISVKYLSSQPSLNSRQARWMEFSCEFDFEIKHIKGKENKVVDVLRKENPFDSS